MEYSNKVLKRVKTVIESDYSAYFIQKHEGINTSVTTSIRRGETKIKNLPMYRCSQYENFFEGYIKKEDS